ncbi:MAG: alpha-glucosidase [Clostridia bacterium]|nr:alpha-glucosidase [Clostridia bacterium]
MIKRYAFGNRFETDTVPVKPEISSGEIPFLTMDQEKLSLTMNLESDDCVYGLGENARGINKRGWIYRSCATDDGNHQEDIVQMYSAHNFLVVNGSVRFGLFVDYPGVVTFDVGYTELNTLSIQLSDLNADFYFITGESVLDIVHQFRQLIGRSYIPPRWAMGFGQSRWGYVNEADVRNVVKRYRELNIPLDSVYLDIDYMDHYKDFTVDPERFPSFSAFVEEMKTQGIHLVPIIDAAVKSEKGYSVCDEGLEKGYFCTKEDGTVFEGAVWPGLSLFPDVLNEEARRWFGDQYKVLLDQGIEGFWNDMNEPAIFYTEDQLESTLEQVSAYQGKKLDLEAFWAMMGLFHGAIHSPDTYSRFYHNVNGRQICHETVHNLYGYNMTRAAGEAFERLSPEKRVLLFSRSSCIGMHRYGGTWMGDNCSWWSHILLNLKMLPSLNMCGFLYTGADIGGFGRNTTEDLVLRWLELGIFTPLMRNHSARLTREQEAYQFTDTDGFRHVISMRYVLLPYIYSEFVKAALRDEMMYRPLAFDYPADDRARGVEDQLMLGDGMMIAPVYVQNAVGRMVYLPETMKLYRFHKDGTTDETVLEAGDHYVSAALSEVILFVRPNHMIPVSDGGHCEREVDFNDIHFLSFPNGKPSVYEYYTDDGVTRNITEDAVIRYRMEVDGSIARMD